MNTEDINRGIAAIGRGYSALRDRPDDHRRCANPKCTRSIEHRDKYARTCSPSCRQQLYLLGLWQRDASQLEGESHAVR
jgi:hypothetical protein